MVRTKQILVCNPRPNPCVPCLNPSKKRTNKKRRNSSLSPNHDLVGKAQMLLDRLKSYPITNKEDREYINIQIRRALGKIDRLS